MSKFGGEDYIVLIHEIGDSAKVKDTVSASAMSYVARNRIPLSRRFSTRKRETSQKKSFDLRPFDYTGEFSPLEPASLQPVTIKDKLFVFGHADDKEIGPVRAKTMATLLYAHGLRAAGLITFKACSIGVGTFLDDFVDSLNRIGVVIGWAKGYTGSAITKEALTDDGLMEDVWEKIVEKVIVAGRLVKREVTGDDRVKIVRSPNNPFTTSFGRYA